ncbi:uncharacterized protein LOC126760461 [Bactrocera neohumeralis]|uniref:uncharacterized protein LOC126760461 n=1 Tax=Bactrocera neohumeralis TaxID=98809 RepID=UPI00216678A8|nr:uncharacterized protein LOC126760461 [Bactrocera neohumeralis]
MENDRKESKVCLDQIEKIMQELDTTNTESNSSTPPALDVPHRPILLPPEIKEEPKERDTEIISQQEDVCNNNELVAVPTHISENPKSLSSTQGQNTQHTMQIKKERVEDSNEVSVEPPKTDKDITSSEKIQTPVEERIIRIKPEPVDAPSLATEEISRQKKQPNPDAAPENATYNSGGEVPTETNMDDSTAPNSPNGVPEADGALPDNFFDDLIKDADNITAAALECSEPNTLEKESTEMLVNVKNEPVDTTTIPEATTTETLESTKHTAEQNIAPPELLNVKSEPVGTTAVSETTTSAPIPENFFDDLLVDHVAERIDDVVNHGLEIKYSERLKELELLEAKEQSSHKAHKKNKKKKKKSHKRTHSEANEDEKTLDVNVNKRSKHTSHSPSMPQAACIRVKSEFTAGEESTLPGGTLFSNHMRPDTFNLDSIEPETSAAAARRMIRVKSEFVTNLPAAEESDDCLPVRETEHFQRRSNVNRNGLIMDSTAPLGFKRIKMESDSEESEAEESILPKDKMENSKQRAILAIEEFNKASKNRKDPSFIYTTTVRKLPNSSSYIRQQIYDNRSPLHNVNNVLYKFNSYANHFNLQEWGIEALPPKASEVAKILGFDIHALDKKKKIFTFPPEIKREAIQQTEKQLIDPHASFLRSESTQTDDVSGHDKAVQTIPQGNNIGTQTTAMSAAGSSKYGDLPLMRQISTFNENQLMALSDFADLIREPALAADSTELYRLHHRLIDIYKYSQLPSEFGQSTQHSNKYNMHDPRQKRMNSLAESLPPPAPRMLARHETQPQSWPHTVVRPHAVVQPPYHRPLAPLPPQTTVPIRQRLERTADMAYTIPVIANVMSIHHNGSPPRDPRQNTFGGGAMRR